MSDLLAMDTSQARQQKEECIVVVDADRGGDQRFSDPAVRETWPQNSFLLLKRVPEDLWLEVNTLAFQWRLCLLTRPGCSSRGTQSLSSFRFVSTAILRSFGRSHRLGFREAWRSVSAMLGSGVCRSFLEILSGSYTENEVHEVLFRARALGIRFVYFIRRVRFRRNPPRWF